MPTSDDGGTTNIQPCELCFVGYSISLEVIIYRQGLITPTPDDGDLSPAQTVFAQREENGFLIKWQQQ